jgi:hypothetical protein
MSHKRAATTIGALLALTTLSCEVITEVMPVSVTTPKEVPTSAPVAARTATPTDVPATPPPPINGHVPTRPPTPQPGDPPDGQPTNVPGCPNSWPPSCAPAASASIVTFWVMCGTDIVPNSKYATSAAAACQVKLDCTPKDASGVPTQTSDPVWTFNMSNPAYWVGWGGGRFNPTVHGEGNKGQFTAYATVDGVRSNDLVFHFN